MMSTPRIDVHHHLIPPAFAAAMKRRGLSEVAGAPLPAWDAARSLSVMDDNDIGTALLSLSAPGVHFGDAGEAVELARACNEAASALQAVQPERFGFFAALPMPDVQAACAEAIYALDTLKADGIVLLGSTQGLFLGDPCFEELMAELDRRKAVVFIHPNLHATSTELELKTPGFLIEFLCDTTRAALNLILTGTIERYPSIRFILAHAGGFLPYVAWRASLANLMAPYDRLAPQGLLHYIRRYYYDTALSPGQASLAALQTVVPESQILFGSDFPFAPAPLTALQCRTLEESPALNPPRRDLIYRTNALALFPRLALPGDATPVADKFRVDTLRHLKAFVRRPLISAAEWLRNR